MKFPNFKSKKTKKVLLWIGIPLSLVVIWVGYEVYMTTRLINDLKEGLGAFGKFLNDLDKAFSNPTDTIVIDSLITDSLLLDSLKFSK